MGSVSDRVRHHLARDAVAREALLREFVNHHALARWLIQTYGWDASESAVVSALRRYEGQAEAETFRRAARLFAEGQLSLRANVCILALPKSAAAQNQLSDLFDLVDYKRGEALRVIQSERTIKVLVDEANLDGALEVLGEDRVDVVLRGLTEITVLAPEESLWTPGVLALVFDTLAGHGINVVEVVSALAEILLVVEQGDALGAYEALEDLIEQTAPMVNEPGGRGRAKGEERAEG